MTQRAIAASPIMVGGSMLNMDEHSMKLLTNPEMLSCVRNGVHGKLYYEEGPIEAWHAPAFNADEYGFVSYEKGKGGWLAIFNRSEEKQSVELSGKLAKVFKGGTYMLHNVWKNETRDAWTKSKPIHFEIEPNGAVFLKYEQTK